MQAIGVVDVCMMVLYRSALCQAAILGGALDTVWFSKEIQFGIMIEAKVNAVAEALSVGFCAPDTSVHRQ